MSPDLSHCRRFLLSCEVHITTKSPANCMSSKSKDVKPKFLQMPLSTSMALGPEVTTSPIMQSPPTLIEFVTTVPTPLASELVFLAPYIQAIRHTAQILSWQSSWEESWLALAAWWAFCLLSEPTLRYACSLCMSQCPTLADSIVCHSSDSSYQLQLCSCSHCDDGHRQHLLAHLPQFHHR